MVYYSSEQSSNFNERKPVEDIIKIKNIESAEPKKRVRKIKWLWIFFAILIIIAVSGGYAAYALNSTFNSVSGTSGSILKTVARMLPLECSIFKILPLEKNPMVEAIEDGTRINFLVLGIRGRGDPNGGLLSDSIMIISIKPETNQAALISIPRDLYVDIPNHGSKEKINTAYAIGEKREIDGGLALSKEIISNVTGLPIHYASRVDFEAFKEIIDALGGITINLDKPFCDPFQFAEGKICLDKGEQKLNGEKALLYARSRYSTSDFDRARRQQQILIAVKNKAFSTGTLANPLKITAILNTLKNNVRTDIELWEMQDFVRLTQEMQNSKITYKVFDNFANGLLYSTTINGSYVLLPVDGNFGKIQEVCRNIFEK